jgi:hypothetical protein
VTTQVSIVPLPLILSQVVQTHDIGNICSGT